MILSCIIPCVSTWKWESHCLFQVWMQPNFKQKCLLSDAYFLFAIAGFSEPSCHIPSRFLMTVQVSNVSCERSLGLHPNMADILTQISAPFPKGSSRVGKPKHCLLPLKRKRRGRMGSELLLVNELLITAACLTGYG